MTKAPGFIRGIASLLILWAAPSGTLPSYGQSQPFKVTFCELYQEPQKYAGKMVEVRAAVSGYRNPTLDEAAYHPPCTSYMSIRLEFPENVKPKPGFDLQRDQSFQEFEVSWRRGMRVTATFEGRFDPVFTWKNHKRIRVGEGKGFGSKHSDDGRIVLHRVSDVKALQLPQK